MAREEIDRLNMAWVVRWGFHVANNENEDAELRKHNIHRKIVDILSVRKKFDEIVGLAQYIYCQTLLSPSEKACFASYNKGEERLQEFFENSIPRTDSFHSDLYRDMAQSAKINGLKNERTRELQNQWVSHPKYVILGDNPYLEIRKVNNLVIYL